MEENGISEEKLIMDKLFIALSENYTVGNSILSWAFNHFRPNQTTIVIAHVCARRVETPPPMGKEVHPIKLKMEKQDKMESAMKAYLSDCEEHKFNAEKLVFSANVIDQGIVDLIHQHGVNKLVIGSGTPSERGAQMSNVTNAVMNKADPSCNIWFIRDGKLLFTRDSSGSAQQDKEGNRLYADLYELIQKDPNEAPKADNDSELLKIDQNMPKEAFGTNDKPLLLMYEWEHSSHLKEMRRRKELEESLAKEKHEKCLLAKEKIALEKRIEDYDRSPKDVKQDLKLEDQNQLREERDKAVIEARKLRKHTKMLKLMLCCVFLSWITFWVSF